MAEVPEEEACTKAPSPASGTPWPTPQLGQLLVSHRRSIQMEPICLSGNSTHSRTLILSAARTAVEAMDSTLDMRLPPATPPRPPAVPTAVAHEMTLPGPGGDAALPMLSPRSRDGDDGAAAGNPPGDRQTDRPS
jgi:hypothetical protein